MPNSTRVQPDIIIDFPYLNNCAPKTNFDKEIYLLNLLPYIIAPYDTNLMEKLKAPISAVVIDMLLEEQTEGWQKRFRIDAYDNKNTANPKTDCNMLEKLLSDDITYIFSIYAVTKSFLKNHAPTYGYNHAFIDSRKDDSKFNEYQVLGTKTLEENAWKRFKPAAHLIYGYIEALYANQKIPNISAEIAELKKTNKKKYLAEYKKFMRENLPKILLDTESNAKLFNDIIGYSLYAQNIFIEYTHKNNSNKFYKVLLPAEKFEKEYKLKAKEHYFEQIAIK